MKNPLSAVVSLAFICLFTIPSAHALESVRIKPGMIREIGDLTFGECTLSNLKSILGKSNVTAQYQIVLKNGLTLVRSIEDYNSFIPEHGKTLKDANTRNACEATRKDLRKQQYNEYTAYWSSGQLGSMEEPEYNEELKTCSIPVVDIQYDDTGNITQLVKSKLAVKCP